MAAWLALSGMFAPLLHAEDEAAQTLDSAVFLLQGALQPRRDGRHVITLLALRLLGDPDLEPLFLELARADDPVLKIHGLLGLAEIDPARKLDLVRIAAIERAVVQEQAIAASMEAQLLSDEQAEQLINWPGLDLGVRVLVASQLVEHGKFKNLALLDEAAKAEKAELRAVAQLLRLHLGERNAMAELDKLRDSHDDRAELLLSVLLTKALAMNTRAIGPWAYRIAADPKVPSRLGLLALKTALRFQAPQAPELWLQQFTSTTDLAQQTRLALIAFREARWSTPEMYGTLAAAGDPVLQHLGHCTSAVANKRGVAEAVIAMVGMDPPHPMVNEWVQRFVDQEADPRDAKAILLAIVLNFDKAERFRSRMFDDVVGASKMLQERFPDDAGKLLPPILQDPGTSSLLAKGILLGLINATKGRPDELVAALPPSDDIVMRNLVWLLRAKHGQKLTDDQRQDLAQMVRGGGVQQLSLRVQAAWLYLKLTGQTRPALARVLEQ